MSLDLPADRYPQRTGSWFKPVKARFHAYAAEFRDKTGIMQPMQKLKYDHCMRVSCDAREIATDLEWSPMDIQIAELIGLFHDVGRFSQYREFRTFYDPKSVNHAQRGFEVLRDNRVLEGLPSEAKHWIEQAVLVHNQKTVPKHLDPEETRFINIARDADKLDDFAVLNDAIRSGNREELQGIIWNLSMDSPPNPVIFDDIRARRMTSYENVKSLTDFNLIQLSWVYDINFAPTLRRIQQRRIIERIVEVIPQTPELAEAVTDIQKFVQDKTK